MTLSLYLAVVPPLAPSPSLPAVTLFVDKHSPCGREDIFHRLSKISPSALRRIFVAAAVADSLPAENTKHASRHNDLRKVARYSGKQIFPRGLFRAISALYRFTPRARCSSFLASLSLFLSL